MPSRGERRKKKEEKIHLSSQKRGKERCRRSHPDPSYLQKVWLGMAELLRFLCTQKCSTIKGFEKGIYQIFKIASTLELKCY